MSGDGKRNQEPQQETGKQKQSLPHPPPENQENQADRHERQRNGLLVFEQEPRRLVEGAASAARGDSESLLVGRVLRSRFSLVALDFDVERRRLLLLWSQQKTLVFLFGVQKREAVVRDG